MVLGLPWFELHNPNVDCNLWRISSKSKNKKNKIIQPLILEARAFACAIRKNIAFAIYDTTMVLWILQQRKVCRKFSLNITISKMYLRRRMLTYFRSTI